MPSLTVENYLKSILQLAIEEQSEWVSPGRLATALEVVPGTVTNMLKTLSESGLAKYKPYSGVCLTKQGRTLALRMIRRHRLLELFLVRTLDLKWDQVHAEAENMEHAVSDALIDRIDEFLGHPETDPHGDPIPSANGDMRGATGTAVSLAECAPPAELRVSRVLNQTPDFLRFLAEKGLRPGARLAVEQHSPEAGVVTIRVEGASVTLGHEAAGNVLVEPAAG